MPETQYLLEQVLRKRPYLTLEMCLSVIAHPIRREMQGDGRCRFWGSIVLQDEEKTRILRVVTLEDGLTIHNAFIDRNFREDEL
jgi:hypothetical protein